VIPAIAYSIRFSLQTFRAFRKTPHQQEEDNDDSDIKDIQHHSPHDSIT